MGDGPLRAHTHKFSRITMGGAGSSATTVCELSLGWARLLLFVLPPLAVYLMLLGLLLDGCVSGYRYLSDTMNNSFCLGEHDRWSARLLRWAVWHGFFAAALAQRALFLPRSRTRNAFAACYAAFGLGALYSGAAMHKQSHATLGGLFFITMLCELSALWYPVCSRRRSGEGRRCALHGGALAFSAVIWSVAVAFFVLYVGPEVAAGVFPEVMIGGAPRSFDGARVSVILQWLLITLAQVLYFVRAPILLAEARSTTGRIAVRVEDVERSKA